MTAAGADGREREILAERAQRLAQPLPDPAAVEDTLELLVFERADAAYAIEVDRVIEVVVLPEPTPIPATPAAVIGIVSHRGRVTAVVDVAALLPSETAAVMDEDSYTVVVRSGAAYLGLLADAVSGVREIAVAEVRFGHAHDARDPVVAGVTSALTAILDVDALARDPRVEVNDEVM